MNVNENILLICLHILNERKRKYFVNMSTYWINRAF